MSKDKSPKTVTMPIPDEPCDCGLGPCPRCPVHEMCAWWASVPRDTEKEVIQRMEAHIYREKSLHNKEQK